jgi:predicted transcriptional regulator
MFERTRREAMQITLDSEVCDLLAAQVDSGRFPSIETAIAALVRDDAVGDVALDAADLSWAKPLVEEGLADLVAGRFRPATEVHAALRQRFRASEG